MNSQKTPFEHIRESIKHEQYLPYHLLNLLPKRWRRVGTVGILELPLELQQWKNQIGQNYMDVLTELTTIVQKSGMTFSQIRTPQFEILAGNPDAITLHKELGTNFWIDVLKLTFSTGNHAERQRLINITQEDEQIIDMFACVGNLSLPISVHHSSCQIIGIEINPYAYSFLEKNIQINHLETRYQAILGDNRERIFPDWADRIVMGYFEISTSQMNIALQSLKQNLGGIIHAHGLTTDKHPFSWVEEVNSLLPKEFPQFELVSAKQRLIKTVAPGVNHFVEDITISVK